MNSKKQIGDIGEKIVSDYLLEKGYEIIYRNFRVKGGEIDIIAKQRDTLVFVEVKTRKNSDFAFAREFVDIKKQSRIIKTANEFISRNKIQYKYIRFDVFEYYTENKRIEHFVDAF